MTTDLWMLVASTLLCWVQILVAAFPIIKDPKVGLGNRDNLPAMEGIWARAGRAANNMKENLPLFAIIVLVAHVSGKADAASAMGAQVFFGARLAHFIIYALGIPGLRTLAWATSIAGIAMVASTLF